MVNKKDLIECIKNEKDVDLLISIADPHHIHWGCSKAKKALGNSFPKKWIADCGDPFMMNNKLTSHKPKFEKVEREFCESADFITVPISSAPQMYYKEYRDKIKVIPQGFRFNLPNGEDFKTINEVPTFVFAGTFLSDIRNPTNLFEFLVSLQFIFYEV